MIPDVPQEELAALYRGALLGRRFEEAVVRIGLELFGWYHTAIGQECTQVTTARLLQPSDYSSCTYRHRPLLLGAGVDPSAVMAELFGKAAGLNRGFAGPTHLVSPDNGIICNSAMLGGTAPQMVGAALTHKIRGSGGVSVTWFGDGTVGEGAVYEAVCLASLWQVPVVFICENDRILEATPATATGTIPAPRIPEIFSGFNVSVRSVDGADVGLVHKAVSEAVASARGGGGPWFLEIRTQAWPGKSTDPTELPGGAMDLDLACGLRPINEGDTTWQVAHDPLALFTRELLAAGLISVEEVKTVDQSVCGEVNAAVEFARSAPFPQPSAVYDGDR